MSASTSWSNVAAGSAAELGGIRVGEIGAVDQLLAEGQHGIAKQVVLARRNADTAQARKIPTLAAMASMLTAW